MNKKLIVVALAAAMASTHALLPSDTPQHEDYDYDPDQELNLKSF